MRSPDIEDLQLLDLSAAAPAYAPLVAPEGAVWPRAVVRFHQGWWTAKVWLQPGVPARRKALLLAGMHSDRTAAFKYANQQVGILRNTIAGQQAASAARTESSRAVAAAALGVSRLPKGQAPC
ncbi:hypothetical protein ACTXI0_04695 [Arthrobacter rhombi]|uniref:hypothetical protein n=1 Tax=Arthrobacter rhombi TaxID=71253 RepID=UPI003FD586F6